MKFIDDMDIRGKKVLFRFDFNVPLDSSLNITDDTRIRAVLPSINHALDEGRPGDHHVPSGPAEGQAGAGDEPGAGGKAAFPISSGKRSGWPRTVSEGKSGNWSMT